MRTRIPLSFAVLAVLAVTLVGVPAVFASPRLAVLCALLFVAMVWGSVVAWSFLLVGIAFVTTFLGLAFLHTPNVGLAALTLAGLVSFRLLTDARDHVVARSAARHVRPLRRAPRLY